MENIFKVYTKISKLCRQKMTGRCWALRNDANLSQYFHNSITIQPRLNGTDDGILNAFISSHQPLNPSPRRRGLFAELFSWLNGFFKIFNFRRRRNDDLSEAHLTFIGFKMVTVRSSDDCDVITSNSVSKARYLWHQVCYQLSSLCLNLDETLWRV